MRDGTHLTKLARIQREVKRKLGLITITGADIRSLRAELDLSRTEFAALVGASAASVSGWERDAHKPLMPHSAALEKLLEKQRRKRLQGE